MLAAERNLASVSDPHGPTSPLFCELSRSFKIATLPSTTSNVTCQSTSTTFAAASSHLRCIAIETRSSTTQPDLKPMICDSASRTTTTTQSIAATLAASPSVSNCNVVPTQTSTSSSKPSDPIYCPSSPAVPTEATTPKAENFKRDAQSRRRRAKSLQVPLYRPDARRSSFSSGSASSGFYSPPMTIMPSALRRRSSWTSTDTSPRVQSPQLPSSADMGGVQIDTDEEPAISSLPEEASVPLDEAAIDEAPEALAPTIDIVGCLTKQVAGHSALLRAKGGKVCKPLDERELWFYESLDNRGSFLKRFTPKYHGCVALNRGQLGFLLTNQRNRQAEAEPEATGTTETQQNDGRSSPITTIVEDNTGERTLRQEKPAPIPSSQSAWSRQLSSSLEGEVAAGSDTEDVPRPYIVIDDITAGYEKPCILDIKMGKQEVKHSQGTTTSLYGFRVLGMMVFEPSSQQSSEDAVQTGQYRQFDKYQGRALREETVRSRLADFFWNGTTLRIEAIPVILEKLKKLLELWKGRDAYKIMSGSLLFIYEGMPNRRTDDGEHEDERLQTNAAKADVKMIDFQHAYPFEEEEKDDGYRWGLENLIQLFEDVLAACSSIQDAASCPAASLSDVQRQLLHQLPYRGSGDL